MQAARDILQHTWGYPDFRPGQAEIIAHVLDGKDTLALLPTGGGKSICYQVPALVMDALCIVVSPLIALMEDQVVRLRQLNIPAAAVTSVLRKDQVDTVLDNAVFGRYRFLYVSPERLSTVLFKERVKRMDVGLIAVDEAHCISQWGHDFRPAYRAISGLREIKPEVPIIALTATATEQTVEDITVQLGFRHGATFRQTFHRPNLAYMALQTSDKLGLLLRICRKNSGSGIVYAPTRRATRYLTAFLRQHGFSVAAYHAGLEHLERQHIQQAWVSGQTRIVVATNAFGMGIDKAEVRFVVHLHIPESPEAYFQEAGRAGRDGKKAHALLVWNEEDLRRLEEHFEERFPVLKEVRSVYDQALGFLQIAYGAGEGTTHPFALSDFAQRFSKSPRPVFRALQLLESAGYISLSDSFHHPATFQFTASRTALYDFQVRYPKPQAVLTDVLRAYEGIFDHPVPIDVRAISRRTNQSFKNVEQALQVMQELELAVFNPASDGPQLTLITERLRPENVSFDQEHYESRRHIAREQLEAMRRFVSTAACRSVQLLAYFNETEAQNCGHCDWCRKLTVPNPAELLAKIGALLKHGPQSLEAILESVDHTDRTACTEALRQGLMDGRWKRDADELFHRVE